MGNAKTVAAKGRTNEGSRGARTDSALARYMLANKLWWRCRRLGGSSLLSVYAAHRADAWAELVALGAYVTL